MVKDMNVSSSSIKCRICDFQESLVCFFNFGIAYSNRGRQFKNSIIKKFFYLQGFKLKLLYSDRHVNYLSSSEKILRHLNPGFYINCSCLLDIYVFFLSRIACKLEQCYAKEACCFLH